MFSNISLTLITNNVKGIQSYKKRLKSTQYFKEKKGSAELLLLQETHSNSKIEQKWKEDLIGHVFFSPRNTKICSVLTAYIGKGTFAIKKQETDKEGHISILDVSLSMILNTSD